MLTQTPRLFFHVGVFRPLGFKQLLKATVTNDTLSCLIPETVLLQDVDKGSVKLCWCMVDVVDMRSQRCGADPGLTRVPGMWIVLGHGSSVPTVLFTYAGRSVFYPCFNGNLNMAHMERWAQTGFGMRGLVQ